MIIWLASYPRSGNGFTHKTLRHHYDIKYTSSHRETPEQLKKMSDSGDWYLVKTHSLPMDNSPALYLVRDGRDCYVSYTHFLLWRELGDDYDRSDKQLYLDRMRKLIPSETRFGGWSKNVKQWTNRTAPTKILYFREFTELENPIFLFRDSLRELGINLSEPVKENLTFDTLQKKEPHLFRRGKIGSHQDEMPPELEDLFWKYHGEMMIQMGFEK